MADKYDELVLRAKQRSVRKNRFTGGFITVRERVTAGPTPKPEAPSTPIGENSYTFWLTGSGTVERWSGQWESGPALGYVAGCPPPWPPQGFFNSYEAFGGIEVGGNPSFTARKLYACNTFGQAPYSTYRVSVGFLKFDTSSLPDDVVVSGATLRFWAGVGFTVGDNRKVSFEWYDWTEPRGMNVDWAYTEGTNAHPGTPLSVFPHVLVDPRTGITLSEDPGSLEAPWIDVGLKDAPAHVSKTSSTKLRMHITGGAPGDDTGAGWSDYVINLFGEDPRRRGGLGGRVNEEVDFELFQYVPQLIVYYD